MSHVTLAQWGAKGHTVAQAAALANKACGGTPRDARWFQTEQARMAGDAEFKRAVLVAVKFDNVETSDAGADEKELHLLQANQDGRRRSGNDIQKKTRN